MDSDRNTNETTAMFSTMAYSVLPEAVRDNPEEVIRQLSLGVSGTAFFYRRACARYKKEPEPEALAGLAVQTGSLDKDNDYFLIVYPVPPPIQNPSKTFDQAVEAVFANGVIAGPYFSAVVRDNVTAATGYFTLVQSLDGGVALNQWLAGRKIHTELGCVPDVSTFLSVLRQHLPIPLPPQPKKRWWKFGR